MRRRSSSAPALKTKEGRGKTKAKEKIGANRHAFQSMSSFCLK